MDDNQVKTLRKRMVEIRDELTLLLHDLHAQGKKNAGAMGTHIRLQPLEQEMSKLIHELLPSKPARPKPSR